MKAYNHKSLLLINFTISVFIIFFLSGCIKHNESYKTNVLRGEFIGQQKPGDNPQVFAPGFVSTNLGERDAAFTPDGKEFYYSLWTGSFGVILVTKETKTGWSNPEIVSFSHNYSNIEPFITTDGKKLFFSSNRPIEKTGDVKDYDIWYVTKTDSGWSDPINVGSTINSNADEFYPSIADNGNLYFTSQTDKSLGSEDIWVSKFKDGNYEEPGNLGEAVNSKTDEFNAFIAPDESYIIFSNWGRKDGSGGGDLYISFNDENGTWLPSKNLGENINSPQLDFCPYVTRDGKYCFFTSRRLDAKLSDKEHHTYSSLKQLLNSPQNGNNDIYWMSSSTIFRLKDKVQLKNE